MYVGPLLDGGLEAGHEVLWGPPRPSLHARDRDEDQDGYDKKTMLMITRARNNIKEFLMTLANLFHNSETANPITVCKTDQYKHCSEF